MKRLMILAGLLCCAGGIARANLYDIYYDGSALPEQESWQRQYGGGGAIRTIEPDPDDPNNFVLSLDSMGNQMIYDSYAKYRQIDPDNGELWQASWRLLVEQSAGYYDAGIGFSPDGAGDLEFVYLVDRIRSDAEAWSMPITPGVYHTYHLESWDMVHYRFWIDGQYVRDGVWDLNSLNQSFVFFGDPRQGAGALSLSKWDYVHVWVVPEPMGSFAMALCACAARARSRN